MEGGILTERIQKEIKALFIIIFAFALGVFVKERMIIFYLGLIFILLVLTFYYVKTTGLGFCENILAFIFIFYNVISIGFMIQYIRGEEFSKTTTYFLKPIIENGGRVYFVLAILIFTTAMILGYNFIGVNNGKEE